MGQCLETSLVVTTGGVGATGVEWGTAKDAAKCPTMHWTVPHSKGLNSTQRPSAEVEKVSSKSVALKKDSPGSLFRMQILGVLHPPPTAVFTIATGCSWRTTPTPPCWGTQGKSSRAGWTRSPAETLLGRAGVSVRQLCQGEEKADMC